MGGLYDEVPRSAGLSSKDKNAAAGKPRVLTGYGLKSEKKNGNGFPPIPPIEPGDRHRSSK